MTPFAIAKTVQESLDRDVTRLGEILNAFPHDGPMGLVPDAIRVSPEYREAKRAFDAAFARLRSFNGSYVKRYAKELREERNRKHA